jgi:hypothetical protein
MEYIALLREYLAAYLESFMHKILLVVAWYGITSKLIGEDCYICVCICIYMYICIAEISSRLRVLLGNNRKKQVAFHVYLDCLIGTKNHRKETS